MNLATYRWLGVHAWSARQRVDLLVELLAAAMGRFLEGGADCGVQADFLFGRCGVAAGVDRGGGAAPTGSVVVARPRADGLGARCHIRGRSRRGRRSYTGSVVVGGPPGPTTRKSPGEHRDVASQSE